MVDFFEFYANGGVMNHGVTLSMVIGVIAVALHVRSRKLGDEGTSYLQSASRMASLCAACGVLGAAFGVIETGAALQMVPADQFDRALSLGLTVVPISVAWGLMCAIPLWTTTILLKHLPSMVRMAPPEAARNA